MADQYTAVITGAAKGIGAEIARNMLAQNYTVITIDIEPSQISHERLITINTDLMDNDAVEKTAAQIAAGHKVTHLIHNAGLIWPNLLEDTKAEDITGLAQLHLGSALTLAKAFLPAMKEKRFGRIIFNGSRAMLGVRTRTAYAATKAGIAGMARTWALELAQHQITVNVVAPGPVLTDNFWGIVPKDGELQQKIANGIPVGRVGTVEDIAYAFMFFADPKSSFITGQTLYVCGGASIGIAVI
jgi:3-oxoacyl-[acyl-carrier protein] reductase